MTNAQIDLAIKGVVVAGIVGLVGFFSATTWNTAKSVAVLESHWMDIHERFAAFRVDLLAIKDAQVAVSTTLSGIHELDNSIRTDIQQLSSVIYTHMGKLEVADAKMLGLAQRIDEVRDELLQRSEDRYYRSDAIADHQLRRQEIAALQSEIDRLRTQLNLFIHSPSGSMSWNTTLFSDILEVDYTQE